jgi:hypothetical protein
MVPIVRLKGILIDLYGVHTMEEFKVIDIVDNTSPYPTFLGIDWDFDNQAIIDMKNRNMIFDSREYRVIVPLYFS